MKMLLAMILEHTVSVLELLEDIQHIRDENSNVDRPLPQIRIDNCSNRLRVNLSRSTIHMITPIQSNGSGES